MMKNKRKWDNTGTAKESRAGFPVIAQNACSTFLHMLAHLRQPPGRGGRVGGGGEDWKGQREQWLECLLCVLSVIAEIYQPPVDE